MEHSSYSRVGVQSVVGVDTASSSGVKPSPGLDFDGEDLDLEGEEEEK
jgi:hypothetical protein